MDTPLLRDQQVFPAEEALKNSLGPAYSAFEELMKTIKSPQYGLEPQWNYYNDGKAWLCKACFKKKTVFWLSVWDHYFKTAFYFTEKTQAGIDTLDIDKSLKEEFKRNEPIGKLIPLVINIDGKARINDLLKVIEYKKNLK